MTKQKLNAAARRKNQAKPGEEGVQQQERRKLNSGPLRSKQEQRTKRA